MCGILGTNFLSNNFKSALNLLNNRGPDFQKNIKKCLQVFISRLYRVYIIISITS